MNVELTTLTDDELRRYALYIDGMYEHAVDEWRRAVRGRCVGSGRYRAIQRRGRALLRAWLAVHDEAVYGRCWQPERVKALFHTQLVCVFG